jgi:hypothetical protein
MRRFLTVAGLLLALGCVGCDPNDPKVDAANRAIDAGSQMDGWPGLVAAVIGLGMSAFGLRRANVGNAYVKSPYDIEDGSQILDMIEKHPELATRLVVIIERAKKGMG